MPRIIVFLGPSLDQASAAKILAAEYRPPAKRGDILAAVADGADIIGLIDGVFHQDCAVTHREILTAVKGGITVVGASSMGALRAAEMDTLGMTGIGRIYHMYKDGTITSDDEVALVFDPVSGYALSSRSSTSAARSKKQRRPASSPHWSTRPCLAPHARSSTRSDLPEDRSRCGGCHRSSDKKALSGLCGRLPGRPETGGHDRGAGIYPGSGRKKRITPLQQCLQKNP